MVRVALEMRAAVSRRAANSSSVSAAAGSKSTCVDAKTPVDLCILLLLRAT